MIKNIKILNLLFLVFAASCTLAPSYKKPKPDMPFRLEDETKQRPSTIRWQDYYQSADLQRVVQISLENNRDLRMANLNIEVARENHGIARANLFPTINAVGTKTKQGVPSAFAAFTPRTQYRANLALATYELDFFGRLRSLKKSALEQFLATEQARNVIKISLISETVNSYAQLALDSEMLKIIERNLNAQQSRFKFGEMRYNAGLDSQITFLVSQTVFESSKILYETYLKLVKQDKNALMVLMGVFDEKLLPQNVSVNDIVINEKLLDLAPSTWLLARPDIAQAEHNLISANANIGAARAAFFPSITLTGSYGYASRDLNSLFDSRTWVFAPQINLPIFTGGRNLANLEIANLEKKIEIANYEKTIQNAFREVLDELAQKQAIVNQLNSYNEVLKIRSKFFEIGNARLNEGLNSQIDLIDAELLLLLAQEDQITARKTYIANMISLYKVLGGGSEVVEEVDKKDEPEKKDKGLEDKIVKKVDGEV